MNTIGEWFQQAVGQLSDAAISSHERESAALDASLLLEHVTGLGRSRLYGFPETALTPSQAHQLRKLLQRRCAGEPIAYLTGTREFWSLALTVHAGTLVPRPDTELLVELALLHLPALPTAPIIELGTGCGAIALALAQEVSDRDIIAVERHDPALQTARLNIGKHGHSRVHLVQSNWLDCIADDSAGLILSNPPYLSSNDPHLPKLQYEPQSALVSGQTGLEALEQIIIDSRRVGLPGSLLLLEHGADQGAAVRALLHTFDFRQVQTHRDLAGLDRASFGYHPATTQMPSVALSDGSRLSTFPERRLS